MTKAANLAASANATAGSVTATTLQSNSASTPTVFKDSAGTEVGKLAKAWVAYNGVGQSILSSFNVSSVTYGGTGSYTVNFTNAFSNTNYCIAMGSSTNNSGGLNATYCTASSTTAVGLGTYSIAGGGAGAYRDTNGVYIAVFS